MKTISIVAQARTLIWGTRNSWSLSPHSGSERPGKECLFALEIQGNDHDGYHLVMSPDGFFTADHWYATKQDAIDDAQTLFGLTPNEWSEDVDK